MEKISSVKNPAVRAMRELKDRKAREASGHFIVEGEKMILEALSCGLKMYRLMVEETIPQPDWAVGMPAFAVPRSVLETVCDTKTPQGMCAEFDMPAYQPLESAPDRIVALDGVQDPGNVGTIVRSADAFSCGAVILLEGCADIYSHKAARATMGAVFRREVYSCTAEELFALLARDGIPLYGAALRDDTVDVRDTDLRAAAVAVGSEGRGLREEILARCDKTVRIPMNERCESLNAAMAASILLWEMYRGTR